MILIGISRLFSTKRGFLC